MSDPEYANIHKSIATFVEGLRTLDYATISQIFYEDGLSIGVQDGQISYARRDHWKEMRDLEFAEGIDNTDNVAWFEIKAFERFGNAASVVIELSFSSDPVDYIDLYHMLKTDDGWKIVNKIYHHIEKKKR